MQLIATKDLGENDTIFIDDSRTHVYTLAEPAIYHIIEYFKISKTNCRVRLGLGLGFGLYLIAEHSFFSSMSFEPSFNHFITFK